MYKCINGWTKAQMLAQVKEKFTVRSVDYDGDCVYRGQVKGKETMCAVGCFLPDSLYDPQMEGSSADALINEYGLNSCFPLEEEGMDDFQGVHDHEVKYTKRALLNWIKKNVA